MKLKSDGGQPPKTCALLNQQRPAELWGAAQHLGPASSELLSEREAKKLLSRVRPWTFASSPKYPGRYWTVPGSSSSSAKPQSLF